MVSRNTKQIHMLREEDAAIREKLFLELFKALRQNRDEMKNETDLASEKTISKIRKDSKKVNKQFRNESKMKLLKLKKENKLPENEYELNYPSGSLILVA